MLQHDIDRHIRLYQCSFCHSNVDGSWHVQPSPRTFGNSIRDGGLGILKLNESPGIAACHSMRKISVRVTEAKCDNHSEDAVE